MYRLIILFALVNAPPLRQVDYKLPPVVQDVDSHLPQGHVYRDSDPVTFTHESTHGINSLLRQRFNSPAFYCLNDKAFTMYEPSTTIANVARVVPPSLRGRVYGLYLTQSGAWNNQPSYIFDEFVSYTNGAVCRQANNIQARYESVEYATEFIVYSSCIPMAAIGSDPAMRTFLMWNIERTMTYQRGQSSYLNTLRTSPDAKQLRTFIKSYYGADWARRVLGIN